MLGGGPAHQALQQWHHSGRALTRDGWAEHTQLWWQSVQRPRIQASAAKQVGVGYQPLLGISPRSSSRALGLDLALQCTYGAWLSCRSCREVTAEAAAAVKPCSLTVQYLKAMQPCRKVGFRGARESAWPLPAVQALGGVWGCPSLGMADEFYLAVPCQGPGRMNLISHPQGQTALSAIKGLNSWPWPVWQYPVQESGSGKLPYRQRERERGASC